MGGGTNQLLVPHSGYHELCVSFPSTGYHRQLLEGLFQLQTLDGLDRQGRTAVMDEILADVPGLDEYLEYLVSNGSSVS